MQNLVVLKDPVDDGRDISSKAGNMCFNRFCIDEDGAFELSGVYSLLKSSDEMADVDGENYKYFELARSTKGKGY